MCVTKKTWWIRTPTVNFNNQDFFKVADMLNGAGIQYKAVRQGKCLRFKVDTIDAYRTTVALLEKAIVEFQFFLLKEEKAPKLVVRGFPKTTKADAFKACAIALGFNAKDTTLINIGRKLSFLFPVYPGSGGNSRPFLDVQEIRGQSVKAEMLHGCAGPEQCCRYQRPGHHSAVCRSRLRCVVFGDEHDSKACSLQKNGAAKCCICGKVYPANCRG